MKKNSMAVYVSKRVSNSMKSGHIPDSTICNAVAEMEKGLIEADLGGGVWKKRLPAKQGGKSGGARAVVYYKKGSDYFIATIKMKSDVGERGQEIPPDELATHKDLAKEILAWSPKMVNEALKRGAFQEVKCNE